MPTAIAAGERCDPEGEEDPDPRGNHRAAQHPMRGPAPRARWAMRPFQPLIRLGRNDAGDAALI